MSTTQKLHPFDSEASVNSCPFAATNPSPVRRRRSSGRLQHSYAGKGRRRGQALLLAVLLMVFAALLGSTFVTVVALNLNSTARSHDKTDAKIAAQAALRRVNQQIVASDVGEGWRPEMVSPPPEVSDPAYNAYYTPFERAQGWTLPADFTYGVANTRDAKWDLLKTYRAANPNAQFFVKFPDPRQASVGSNIPTYLVNISRVSSADFARDGLLKITAIGRSTSNDVVFDREEAYKGTVVNGSPFAFAFYTGNYDTVVGHTLVSRLTAGIPLGATASLLLNDPLNLEPGCTLMLWDGTTGASVVVTAVLGRQNVIVRAANGGTIPAFSAGTTVRAATVLMDGLTNIDSSLAGGVATGATLTPTRTASLTHGVYAGGGLLPQNKSSLTLGTNGLLAVTGPIDTPPASAQIDGGTYAASAKVHSESSSPGSRIPVVSQPSLGTPSFSLYRDLTQNYDAVHHTAYGSNFGYGPGLYIDNANDIERIQNGSVFTDLANFQLRRLWQRKPITDKTTGAALTNKLYYLLGSTFPSLATGSLEERGIRGWISPWQYQAPAVTIDLQGDSIVVTRDDRSDSATYVAKPDLLRAWRDPAGIVAGAAGSAITSQGVYRMVLNTATNTRSFGVSGHELYTEPAPLNVHFNGVIFAEGNVRIRGYLGSTPFDTTKPLPPSITVVSMGNIYVEGNIVRDPSSRTSPSPSAPRIALLAKKNVVLNPSGFVAHPNGWQNRDVYLANNATVVTTMANSPTVTMTDASYYRVGDRVRSEDPADSSWHTVIAINSNTLTVTPNFFSVTAGNLVKLLTDPQIVDGTKVTASGDPALVTTSNEFYYDLSDSTSATYRKNEVLSRNVRFEYPAGPISATPLYLAWLSAGQMKKGLDLTRQTTSPQGQIVVKPVTTPGIISAADNTLDLQSVPGTSDLKIDLFDADDSGTPDGDAVETLSKIAPRLNFQPTPLPGTDPQPDWEVPTPTPTPPVPIDVPARDLASTSATLGGAATTATNETVPLALTVSDDLYWNNNPAPNSDLTPASPTPDKTRFSLGTPHTIYNVAVPDPRAGEDQHLDTVSELFYWRQLLGGTAGQRQQAPLSLLVRPVADGSTAASQIQQASNYLTFAPNGVLGLPSYHIGALRLSYLDYNAATTGTSFTPVSVEVQATIFAQNGSWFVIPVPQEIKSANAVDLNNDGTVNGIDTALAADMARLNYHITVRGTIAQNLSPTGALDYDNLTDADGHAVGAAQSWIDALSYPTLLVNTGYTDGGVGGTDWATIDYLADPVSAGSGLVLPVTPDLIFSTA